MSELDLAKARATLIAEQTGGGARVAARRISAASFDALNDPANAGLLAIAADPERAAQVQLTAAAILNANDLAASVSTADRADIAELLSDEIRQRALGERRFAQPKSGAVGAACAAKIRADQQMVAECWSAALPFGLAMHGKDAPPRVGDALKAALALAEGTDG